MATRTPPPPPERALTPPTPLHGPMFDSPRRSSRIYNKQKNSPGNLMDSPPLAATTRKRPTIRPTSSQTLSPPTSPISPNHRDLLSKRKQSRAAQHLKSSTTATSTAAARLMPDHFTKMYPTPMKTPRKRAPHADVGNTARVLFHDRETDPDQIMPTPSKSRAKRHTALSLESFDEEQDNSKKVQIYTDSKERMPEIDEDDDNPFVVKKRAQKADSEPVVASGPRLRPKRKHGMSKKIDEAVEHDKGAVYTFRGKKLYRKFEEDSEGEEMSDDGNPAAVYSDQDIIRHQAGPESRKRFTRSSIKPRLLFPPKNADQLTHERQEDPEEATTDIESPVNDHAEGSVNSQSSFGLGTPPTADDKHKPSPFDSWPRTKPGRGGRSKRAGSPMEKTNATGQKRSRSVQPS